MMNQQLNYIPMNFGGGLQNSYDNQSFPQPQQQLSNDKIKISQIHDLKSSYSDLKQNGNQIFIDFKIKFPTYLIPIPFEIILFDNFPNQPPILRTRNQLQHSFVDPSTKHFNYQVVYSWDNKSSLKELATTVEAILNNDHPQLSQIYVDWQELNQKFNYNNLKQNFLNLTYQDVMPKNIVPNINQTYEEEIIKSKQYQELVSALIQQMTFNEKYAIQCNHQHNDIQEKLKNIQTLQQKYDQQYVQYKIESDKCDQIKKKFSAPEIINLLQQKLDNLNAQHKKDFESTFAYSSIFNEQDLNQQNIQANQPQNFEQQLAQFYTNKLNINLLKIKIQKLQSQ